jgi:hypothetical protein
VGCCARNYPRQEIIRRLLGGNAAVLNRWVLRLEAVDWPDSEARSYYACSERLVRDHICL